MLPLAERWGSPSSPSLLSHLGVGVMWLPRPSAVLDAFWAKDLASPPLSPLASCSRGAPCRCGEGMLPCGCTVSLLSPPSLTVLFDFLILVICFVFLFFVCSFCLFVFVVIVLFCFFVFLAIHVFCLFVLPRLQHKSVPLQCPL